MAKLPSLTEARNAVLELFYHDGVRPNEMLMLGSLTSKWNYSRFNTDDLQSALDSLVESGELYLKDEGSSGAIFISEQGFEAIPESVSDNRNIEPFSSNTYNVNVHGTFARANFDSTDNSTSTISVNNIVFDQIIDELKSLPLQQGLDESIQAAEDLAKHAGKDSYVEKYRKFVSTVSNHASIFSTIVPYLPALESMLRQ